MAVPPPNQDAPGANFRGRSAFAALGSTTIVGGREADAVSRAVFWVESVRRGSRVPLQRVRAAWTAFRQRHPRAGTRREGGGRLLRRSTPAAVGGYPPVVEQLLGFERELRAAGILTEVEFQAKKTAILST
jgi:hypothetical protein